ncbi:MAG: hypothetical protein ACRC92_03435 [Peptostreptococcaceae bacterium]
MMRKNEGSGMELLIVKSFVRFYEGKIRVISNINKYSEFIIKLPIKFDDENHEILSEYPNSTLVSTNVELSDIYF